MTFRTASLLKILLWQAPTMLSSGATTPDQTEYVSRWTTAQIAAKANQWHGSNWQGYSNPDYDAVYKQLSIETDPAKRNELIIKSNDILIQDVAVIPLVARTQPTDGISKTIQGDIPNPRDSVLWNIADWTRAGS